MEFYCGVCSGYCLDVSLTPLSSQFTVVQYTVVQYTVVQYTVVQYIVVQYTVVIIQYYYDGFYFCLLFFERIK